MGKGILLEMAGRQAVVLTPQGEFLKVPVPVGNWDIGDEIEFAEVRQQPAWMRWGTAAAAAAVLFIGSFTGWNVYSLAQPVAVVTVDINPSLELTLNKKDQVLEVVPKNADGQLILKGVDFKRKPFEEVLTALTDRAVEEQKLNPADEAGTVVVGVAPAKESELPAAQAERVVNKAKTAVKTEVEKVARAKGQEPKANVVVLTATVDEKEEAEKEGLPVGKFKVWQTIHEVAPDITPEEIKQSGTGKVLKDHDINPGTVFGKAQKENDEDRSNKGKDKDSKKDDEKAEPTSGTPDDKQGGEQKKDDKAPGQGGSQEPKKDDKPSDTKNNNGAQQNNTPGAEKKNGSDQKIDSGKSNGSEKAGADKKDEPKKEEPKKDTPKKDEPKKDDGKKNSWTIPFLGITIEKPAFLRDKDEDKPAAAAEAPATSTPRAEEPGVGASEPKKEEPKQEQPKQEQPKQEEPKQEEPKKEEPKKEEPKQEQPKQEEPKKEEPRKEEPKDSGKDSEKEPGKGNQQDSGKEKGKDK